MSKKLEMDNDFERVLILCAETGINMAEKFETELNRKRANFVVNPDGKKERM